MGALAALGFRVVREEEHIALRRDNPDGSTTPMTIPNHPTLKGSTLRAICTYRGFDISGGPESGAPPVKTPSGEFLASSVMPKTLWAGIPREHFLRAYDQAR